jgi:aspartate kinase
MVVLKFGGSSVATASALARVRDIVARARRPRVVVVSALAGVTDRLVTAAARAGARDLDAAFSALHDLRARHASLAGVVRDPADRETLLGQLDQGWSDVDTLLRAAALVKACSPASTDAVVAHGELASSRVVAAFFRDCGLPAKWVDARTVVATDARHQHATPLREETATRAAGVLKPLLECGVIPVLGGFIGATPEGTTSTLGRGGSDYSASLIGACLGADEIQIWTDVDGMLTADPRVFGRAVPVDRLSFSEASALSHFGAKVLCPLALTPAIDADISVRILNSRHATRRGTLVTGRPVRRAAPLAAIACRPDLCVLEVRLASDASRPASLADVFGACARAGVAVHLSAVSDVSVSVAVDEGHAVDNVVTQIAPGLDVRRHSGLALIAVVGDRLRHDPCESARVFSALDRIPLHLVSRTPGSNHLAVVVDQSDLAFATATLHQRFFDRGDAAGYADEPDGAVDQCEVPGTSIRQELSA